LNPRTERVLQCNKIFGFHLDYNKRMSMAEITKVRPGTMRLIDAAGYRLPLAGVVSILHRVSGVLMFMLLPFIVWMFDTSVSSEFSYQRFTSAFTNGLGMFGGWFLKLVVLALIWAYLHHAIAGVRHLWMDVTHSVSKAQGHGSAVVTLVSSLVLTVILGAKLFGLY
jgi:succinate dehydrogenase / fumarate reductase cytochrome b subunit